MKYLKSLLKLYEHKELNYSTLPSGLIKELLDENLIAIKRIDTKRKKVIAKEEFFLAYANIQAISNATTRSELVTAKSSSKQKHIAPQDGLFIAGNALIDEKSINAFEQSALFLKNPPTLYSSTLVIIVENFENLIYFQNQCHLFREEDIVFIYRNKAALRFITTLQNKAYYFGDYDLFGIKIYLQEIVPRNSNIPFFIPQNIEELIKTYGNSKLYQKQYEFTKNLNPQHQVLQKLISIIHKYQKTLEQEFFILKNRRS